MASRRAPASLFMMKRTMHEELIRVVAERERLRTEPCHSSEPITRPESLLYADHAKLSSSLSSSDRSESPGELSRHSAACLNLSTERCSSVSSQENTIDMYIYRNDSTEDRRSESKAGITYSKPEDASRIPSVESDRTNDPPKKNLEISAVLSSLIIQDLSQQHSQLPILEGFLEKLCPNNSMVKIWQTRFFFIDGNRLCYSRDFIEVENRQRFEYGKLIINRVPFLRMLCISGDTRNRQFFIEVHDPKRSGKVRQYILRAKSVHDRDRWLEGIKLYAKHYRDVVQLGSLSPQHSPLESRYYDSIPNIKQS